jgi:hypothetical protein
MSTTAFPLDLDHPRRQDGALPGSAATAFERQFLAWLHIQFGVEPA